MQQPLTDTETVLTGHGPIQKESASDEAMRLKVLVTSWRERFGRTVAFFEDESATHRARIAELEADNAWMQTEITRLNVALDEATRLTVALDEIAFLKAEAAKLDRLRRIARRLPGGRTIGKRVMGGGTTRA